MIFIIDQSIIYLESKKFSIFAEAILKASDEHHFIVIDYQTQRWITDTLLSDDQYLGKSQIDRIESNLELWSPDTMCQNNMAKVTIGVGDNFLSVEDMKLIADRQSKVVIENGLYDWEVVKKWVKLYRQDRVYKSINSKVHRAITSFQLVEENAGGGSGSIENRIRTIIPEYKGVAQWKISTIFDSDKDCRNQPSKNSSLINYLQNNKIGFHELNKREIENYFPYSLYKELKFTTDKVPNPNESGFYWDYYDFTPNENTLKNKDYVRFVKCEKDDVLALAEKLTKQDVQSRLAHCTDAGEPDEVQEIILLMAKII